MAQIQGVAAVHEQNVGLLDHGDPTLFFDAGQRGELQHPQGLPTQFAHRGSGFSSADEPPCVVGAAGQGVARGGDAEGAGLGDRFAEQVDQRVADARVLDASGSEKKPHEPLLSAKRLTLVREATRATVTWCPPHRPGTY